MHMIYLFSDIFGWNTALESFLDFTEFGNVFKYKYISQKGNFDLA